MRSILARTCGSLINLFARAITAVRPVWQGIDPQDPVQRVYFANHASHGDFILIWSVLPRRQRLLTRPVAGADYWGQDRLRRFIGSEVFNALLIDRRGDGTQNPVELMASALRDGASLIVFPEGTRNQTDAALLPLKSGIYHLASLQPEVDFVPVWIENLNRVLPKGTIIPVPLMCKVIFGAPLRLRPDEAKDDFLGRAREALISLRPGPEAG